MALKIFPIRVAPVAIARIIVFSIAIIFASNLKLLCLLAGLVYIFFLFWKREYNHEFIK